MHGPVYALSKVIKSLLDSSISAIDGGKDLQTVFQNEEYVTDTTVDYYLKRYLLNILKLPSSEERKKRLLLEVLDEVTFGSDSSFVLKLISRTLLPTIPAEDSSEICCYLALKFHQQRNFPKFINLLMSAVEASQHSLLDFSLHPKLVECLGGCAVKLPISQNMSLWSSMCLVLERDWEQNNDSEGIMHFVGSHWCKKLTSFVFSGSFPQPRVAAQILSALLLNIKLADYSIRDETIEDVIKLFQTVSERLKSLAILAVKNPQVSIKLNNCAGL